MPRFFVDEITQVNTISGEDADHITRSLRLAVGEEIILCDGRGTDGLCRVEGFSRGAVTACLLERRPSVGEPTVPVTLYQALPKSDKLELIIQKAVELGTTEIVPFVSSRCIARMDREDFEKKRVRYNKIAFEAAKQCGRGKIPQIAPLVSYKESLALMKSHEKAILFYEGSQKPIKHLLEGPAANIGIMVGAEGGFSPEEAEMAAQAGIAAASLGNRILRCETAGLAALSIIMYHTDNM